MRSPATALVWEIWRKNRGLAWLAVALTLFGCVFNAVYAESFNATVNGSVWLTFVNSMLGAWPIFFVFGVFSYMEFNPQKQWTGFPYHLFTLPVRTWKLVALPMVAGVATVELTFLAWLKLVYTHGEMVRPGWIATVLGVALVFFQAILWSLAAFRILRLVIVSLVETTLIGVGFMPYCSNYSTAWWISEKLLIPALIALAVVAYAIAWHAVARQRTGGGRQENWLKKLAECALDILPRRRSAFGSAASAQFWYEWRRSGTLLPAIVGAILILVAAPVSWAMRDDEGIVLWILPQVLVLPVILAAATGKNFSKADFWSRNLTLPSFVATRPMATGDMVVVKLKVAALSVAVTWALVLAFLCLWLSSWAKLDQLGMLRIGFWMVYNHSNYPLYLIAALLIAACMLLTWKFLVNGLCVGLSGNSKLFVGTAAVYGFLIIIGITAFATLLKHDRKFMVWVRHDPDQLLSIFEWMAAVAVIGKFWLAAFSWRRNSRKRTLHYLLLWGGATLLLLILAGLIWAKGSLSLFLMAAMNFLPLDPYRLQHFLVLMALLAIPLARLGFAPSALARNRRGDFVGKDEP